ncbi:tellurium resistance protein [Rhodobacter sp. SY28-1]|uniref:SLAC1 family transporter n=1 Tax=Rhodobacter sp. SY28-1 TaxID=2562317 RepID=UPI0010C0E974|nr:tellurium resistance protein [Rhodobacter sp. SY28-1]
MAAGPVRHRPKLYPPPEFPPRKVKLFATTPPAIFPPILGLLGLATALRVGTAEWGVGQELADLAFGLALPLWAFAACTYIVKILRRISVVTDDLKVMPARAGLAAGTLGGMVAAGLLAGFAPSAASVLLLAMLAAHALLVGLTLRVLAKSPPEARQVNPGWHMTFVGFIVATPAAVALGLDGLARGIFYATLPVALAIWAVSLVQLVRRIPPAPLRPLLAIHLAPAALLATTANLTGMAMLAQVFAVLALVILLALVASARWITESGFSAFWGAFTFPTAAASTALMLQGGALGWLGQGLLVLALGVIPWIAYRVLKLWPRGHLAAKTNAAEA